MPIGLGTVSRAVSVGKLERKLCWNEGKSDRRIWRSEAAAEQLFYEFGKGMDDGDGMEVGYFGRIGGFMDRLNYEVFPGWGKITCEEGEGYPKKNVFDCLKVFVAFSIFFSMKNKVVTFVFS